MENVTDYPLPSKPRLYTPEELGFELRFSASKVYHLAKCGLPFIRVGAQRRFDLEECVAWLRVNGARCLMPTSKPKAKPAKAKRKAKGGGR